MTSNKIKILCYGDSNTWGYIPVPGDEELRFDESIRWTAVLQKLLGNNYLIFEDGVNGRTTNLDYTDRVGKNGLKLLPEALERHQDLSLIILMLGTNDLKKSFNQSPEQISKNLEKLIVFIKESCYTKILLMAPPIPKLKFAYDDFIYPELESKAQALPAFYQRLASKYGLGFLSLQGLVESSEIDGIHLEADQHLLLAQTIADLI